MPEKKVAVIDGNSLMHRAFHAVPPTMNAPDGRPTNAIFGFLNMFLKMIDAFNPDGVVVAFDKGKPRVRMEMLPQYKAQRPPMDPDLHAQFPMIKELLAALNVPILQSEGWEGDDILGTMARLGEEAGCDMLLVTGDRDMYQLVTEHVNVVSTRKGLSDVAIMTPESVDDLYHGITPALVPDFYGLKGDTSDNIPGVPGIGEKTALALISKFGSLQGVYDNIEDKAVKPGQRTKLTANRDKADLSYMLGTIRRDAPIETDPSAYIRRPGDPAAAAQLLAALEMHKLVDRWGLESGAAPAAAADAAPVQAVEPSPLPLLLEGRFYAAQNVTKTGDGSWYLVQGSEVYLPDTDRLAALLDGDAEIWAFDAKPLYRLALAHGGVGKALRFDGKLAAYLLNPSASGYEVKSLAAEYGVHAAFHCEDAPDAGVLAGLCDTLAAALDESGQRKLLDEMELPLARVLADMERIGFAIDAAGIRAFGDSLRGELDGILHNIYTEVGYEFNVNSPKQLGEALFDKLGLPPRKKTARGYSTDAETLESLRPYSPVIDEILKYRTYSKLLSTYVDGLLNAEAADGRVHSTFIQTEARTGRISSTEPNLQNIPIRTELGSRLRGYFVAGEGETLVDADYSQIELRILAHITGDEHMQQAFLNGADIHRSTAAKIYHIPESEVTPQLRSASKAINFGIMYGKGAYSLSKDLGISVKEADSFLKTYLDTFPKVDSYMKDCIAHAKDKGYVETLFGRRRALPELASSNFQVRASGERMARNTPIQGTAADIIKLAMVHVWQRLREEKLQARLLLQVHDELIVEAPEAECDAVKRILKEEMENVVHYSVPLTTEVGTGKTWLAAH